MRAILLALVMVLSGCLVFDDDDVVQPTDYIRDDRYPRWSFEVDHVSGYEPSSGDMDFLIQRLNEVVRKDRITYALDDQLRSQAVWTDDQVLSLAAANRDRETAGGEVVTHVLFLDGKHERENVLGVTYGYDVIAVFAQRIQEGCQLLSTQPCFQNEATIRRAVLVHEFGHALGLVDRGIPMVNPHSDGEHHSDNPDSVMYSKVETTGIFGLSQIPTRLDANDKLDICNAGGKGSC